MKIIALDSSGLVASVALLEDTGLVGEYNIQYKKTHSQTLLPMLEELKDQVELELSTVDAIAIASGPGSFTGLRIGSATAKGLAYALQIPAGTCLQSVWHRQAGVSDHGCQKRTGLYGDLCF